MTVGTATSPRGLPRTARPGSLTSPFLRHALVLVGSAALAYLLAANFPAEQQPAVWLAAGIVGGLLGGLIARGWMGLLFIGLGAALGVTLELHLRLGAGAPAGKELQSAGPTLLFSLGLMLLAYAGVLVGLRLLRSRAA